MSSTLLTQTNYYDKEGFVNADLFSSKAEELAKDIANKDSGGRSFENPSPKISQVRKFYNDVLNIQSSIDMAQDKESAFKKWLPYIRMLSAKVDYAKSRKHVNDNFEKFIKLHTQGINTRKDFDTFVTLFEAVIAYCVRLLPKG